jgi:hypothetical protein
VTIAGLSSAPRTIAGVRFEADEAQP